MTLLPCFVISLPDCTVRRTAIRRRLQGLGIPFEFLDAVDGRQGLPPEYKPQIDRAESQRRGRLLADADYACALSHIKAYRRIVAEEIPHALVLEDDALPQPALTDFLAGKHYEQASVTQLYVGSYPYVRRSGAQRLFGDYTSWILAPIMRGGAVAYIVSRDAARHFVDHAVPITGAADWPDCAADIVARREWRIVHPLLCHHPSHREQQAGQSILQMQSLRDSESFFNQRRRYWMLKWRQLPRKCLYKRLSRIRSRDL